MTCMDSGLNPRCFFLIWVGLREKRLLSHLEVLPLPTANRPFMIRHDFGVFSREMSFFSRNLTAIKLLQFLPALAGRPYLIPWWIQLNILYLTCLECPIGSWYSQVKAERPAWESSSPNHPTEIQTLLTNLIFLWISADFHGFCAVHLHDFKPKARSKTGSRLRAAGTASTSESWAVTWLSWFRWFLGCFLGTPQ